MKRTPSSTDLTNVIVIVNVWRTDINCYMEYVMGEVEWMCDCDCTLP